MNDACQQQLKHVLNLVRPAQSWLGLLALWLEAGSEAVHGFSVFLPTCICLVHSSKSAAW